MTCQEIYERIVTSVMEHRLPPGTKLGEDKLARIFGASRARVRQVLARLALERIVVLQPNRGAFVAEPTVAEAREVFEVRRPLEALVVRRIIAKKDPQLIARLRAHVESALDAHQRQAVRGRSGRTRAERTRQGRQRQRESQGRAHVRGESIALACLLIHFRGAQRGLRPQPKPTAEARRTRRIAEVQNWKNSFLFSPPPRDSAPSASPRLDREHLDIPESLRSARTLSAGLLPATQAPLRYGTRRVAMPGRNGRRCLLRPALTRRSCELLLPRIVAAREETAKE